MHQHADEDQDRQSWPTPLPDRAEHRQTDVRTAETNRADREDIRTGGDRTEGRRPTIEPAAEQPRNVTPIGARRDPSEAADKRVSAQRVATEGTSAPHPSLFPTDEAERFRTEWQRVQGAFVDDPRDAIRQADELVSRTITRLSDVFAQERGKLEPRSGEGDTVSTEDLRQALQRYRAFFDRLLSL